MLCLEHAAATAALISQATEGRGYGRAHEKLQMPKAVTAKAVAASSRLVSEAS
jgi:hypothetical protein